MVEAGQQHIDAIDFGRATIAALSYVNLKMASEVHILRLSTAFRRAGISTSLKYALSVLTILREVENLNHGYWRPTPNRFVAIDEFLHLLISASPTAELQRHFPSLRKYGYIRAVDGSQTFGLPSQTLDDWLGMPPLSTLLWTEEFISIAKKTLQPTHYGGPLEFFDVYRNRTGSWCPMWSASPPVEVSNAEGVVLARYRLTTNSSRYFLAEVTKGRIVAESNLPVDAARLQFGLAARRGKRIGCRMERRQESCLYHFNFQLPREERRLLLALSIRQPSTGGRSYLVDGPSANSALRDRFHALGVLIGVM